MDIHIERKNNFRLFSYFLEIVPARYKFKIETFCIRQKYTQLQNVSIPLATTTLAHTHLLFYKYYQFTTETKITF